MCGVAGLIDQQSFGIPERDIWRMVRSAAHRGPDDEGVHIERNLALGHVRLSILDVSDLGHQPMSLGDRYWISYNGEIYNYLELRSDLEKLGHHFSSGTDTEVVLAAYAEWGSECLSRFNGMWALAIYDERKQEVLLARDRFGIKPLYWMIEGRRFGFASEIKQLLSIKSSVSANVETVVEWLVTRFEGHTDRTFFTGVQQFPAAHFMLYDLENHRWSLTRYYDLRPSAEASALGVEEAVEQFRALFMDSIRLRLRSDVTVGTCLSGGLDSSAISAYAAPMHQACSPDPFIGIHARSSEARTDESVYARSVATRSGLSLFEVSPTISDFVSQVDEVVFTQEEPFGSPSMFMGWHVFEEAKKRGCKVMLNGQGGDEVLLGYERYYAALLKQLGPMGRLRAFTQQVRNSRMSCLELLGYYYYFTSATLRSARLRRRTLVRPEFVSRASLGAVRESVRSFGSIQKLQEREIMSLQLPHLLRYEDRSSMRHSIETRLPFLDHRLVEFSLGLPPHLKIRDGWTKWVLRIASKDILPSNVSWRRIKLGFEAPERTWLTAHGERMLREVQGSRLLAELTQHRLLCERFLHFPLRERWAYFSVAAWERVYGVV